MIFKRLLVVPLVWLLTGCMGAFVQVIELDDRQIKALDKTMPVFLTADLKGIDFDFIGSVKATSCFNNPIIDDPASKNDAMNQVKYKASIMGADAVINPICSKEGTSLSKNCWTSITCEAAAIRVNNTDNSGDKKSI
jgi:hypothetical protein